MVSLYIYYPLDMTSCFDLPTWKGETGKRSPSLHLWLHKFLLPPPAFSLVPLPENLDSRYFQTHPTEMLSLMVFHCVQPPCTLQHVIFGGTPGLYPLDASIPSHSHAGTTTRVCRHWQLPWGQALPELKTMFYTIILPALQRPQAIAHVHP